MIAALHAPTAAQRWLLSAYASRRLPPQVRWYRALEPIAPDALAAALEAVRREAPALRLVLAKDDDGWHQHEDARPIAVDLLDPPAGASGGDALAWARAELARQHPDRVAGDDHHPSVAAVLVRDAGERPLVALLADRFATDGRGFDVLEHRLDAVLADPAAGHGWLSVEETPGLTRAATFTADAARVAAVAGRLLDATLSAPRDAGAGAQDVRRRVVVRSPAEAVALLERCRAAGISATMAYAAAQVLVLADRLGTGQVVVNVPVSNRTRQQRALIGNFSTIAHVAVDVGGARDTGALRAAVRDAVLRAVQERNVDPGSVYRELYGRLPDWPPGWNAFCNVRDGLRWTACRALLPVDPGAPDPGDAVPGALIANVRVDAGGSAAEWIWDAARFDRDASEMERLVDRVAAAPDALQVDELLRG